MNPDAYQPPDRDEAAAHWMTLAASGSLRGRQRRAFRDWLEQDSRNRVAMRRVSTVWTAAGTLKSDPDFRAERARARNVRRAIAPDRRPRRLFAALATASVAVVAVGLVVVAPPAAEAYEAPLGEMRRVVLRDGSVITLNTGARIEARYGWFRRDIALVRGEATFVLKADPIKPFHVSVNAVVLSGREGAFAVRDRGIDTSVLRLAGDVLMTLPVGEEPVTPRKGQLTTFEAAGSKIVRERVSAPDQIAWTQGRIVFDDATLAEASREFERYHAVRIVVGDAAAHLPISGAYRSRDLTSFLNAVSRIYPVRWSEVGPGVIRVDALAKTSG